MAIKTTLFHFCLFWAIGFQYSACSTFVLHFTHLILSLLSPLLRHPLLCRGFPLDGGIAW